MNIPTQIAKHYKDVFFGGNWTSVNLKENLATVTWQQATQKVYDLNTIATLTYHISYYIAEVLKVLQGCQLEAKDEHSFKHPPINNEEDWQNMQTKIWADVSAFVELVEQLPEDKLYQPFTNEKYGSYYRNLLGIIEHTHYHLGQISLIKKIVQQQG